MPKSPSLWKQNREQLAPARLGPFGWALAAAVLWALVPFFIHVRYTVQRLPTTLGIYWEIVPRLVSTPGPELGAFWLGHAARALGCLLFFIGAAAIGSAILARFVPDDGEPVIVALKPMLSVGLGLGVLGYLAFALLALRLGQPRVAVGVVVAVCLAGIWWLATRKQAAGPAAASPTLAERLVFISLLLLLLLAFLGSTVPEVSFDALTYHLAVPKTYAIAGRLIDLPHNRYSYLPLLTSMLYYLGLAAGGMYAAKLVSFGLGACLLLSLYSVGRALGGRLAGLLSCAIFAGTPLVIYQFWYCNSDLGCAFFLFLAAASLWSYFQEPRQGPAGLYLSAVFCGLALAAKLTAAFGVVFLAVAALVAMWRDRAGLGWRAPALFGALAVVPLLPWAARNYAYTGNPAYPYLVSVLGPKSTDMEALQGWYTDARDNSPGFRPWRHAEKMWHDAVLGFESATFDNTGPLFVAFSPLVLLGLEDRRVGAGALFVGACLAAGFSNTYITRLLLSYFAPFALIISLAASARALPKACRTSAISILLAITLFNLYRASEVFMLTSVHGLEVATGREATSDYLKAAHNLYPSPSYGAYEFIDGLRLPGSDRILAIGEARTFYSSRMVVTSAPHDPPVALVWADEARDGAKLYRKLKAEGIAVILLNKRQDFATALQKYRTPKAIEAINDLLVHYCQPLYRDNWTIVFKLKDSA